MKLCGNDRGKSPHGVFVERVTPSGTFILSTRCHACPKPLTFTDENGMFCEDKHGYEESIRARTAGMALIKAMLGDFFAEANTPPSEYDLGGEA